MIRKNPRCSLLIVLLLSILILSGCSNKADTEPITLWVLSEKSTPDDMNYQIEAVREQFSEDYPNVSVRIDYLPTDPEERAQYVQELKAGMAEGNAPDLYLLPSGHVLSLEGTNGLTFVQVEPFFYDAAYEMHEGRFYDISKLYNRDKGLDKEALLDSVMDVGMVGRKRYIIPLRFTAPVVYLTGDEAVPFESTKIDDLMQTAIGTKDSALARGIFNYASTSLSDILFSHAIDYQNKQITVSSDHLKEYLSLYGKMRALPDSTTLNNEASLFTIEEIIEASPIRIGSLEGFLAYNAYTQRNDIPLQIQPLENMDGSTVATIEYWGAVDASCKHPAIAYEFLSRFLREDLQWELTRSDYAENQYSGLVANGWPVLARNAAEHLWPNYCAQPRGSNPYRSILANDDLLTAVYDSIDSAGFDVRLNYAALSADAYNAADAAALDGLLKDHLAEIARHYPGYTMKTWE